MTSNISIMTTGPNTNMISMNMTTDNTTEEVQFKLDSIKKELNKLITSFCKEIETFSSMYFIKWNIILEEDMHMSYYIENWCKKAKLENIDALFRNLGIKCRFYPGEDCQPFLYDSSEDFHANNALFITLEDIYDMKTIDRYLKYIDEYAKRFYECLVTINGIPSAIPRYPAEYSISSDVIPIMNNMKNISDSLKFIKDNIWSENEGNE